MFNHLKHRLSAGPSAGLSEPETSPLALPPEAGSAQASGEECKLAFHPDPSRPADPVGEQSARLRHLVAESSRIVREVDIAYHHDQSGRGVHRFINVPKGVSGSISEISLLKKVLEGTANNGGERSSVDILRQAIDEARGIDPLIRDIAIEQRQAFRGEPNPLDLEDEEDSDPVGALHAIGVPSFGQLIPDID